MIYSQKKPFIAFPIERLDKKIQELDPLKSLEILKSYDSSRLQTFRERGNNLYYY